jgi:hypothetical protein
MVGMPLAALTKADRLALLSGVVSLSSVPTGPFRMAGSAYAQAANMHTLG